jgi:GAF domain-containing protein
VGAVLLIEGLEAHPDTADHRTGDGAVASPFPLDLGSVAQGSASSGSVARGCAPSSGDAAEPERARLRALRSYDVSDGALDAVLDAVAEVAAVTTDTLFALVSFVGADLQSVRAGSRASVGLVGLAAPRHLTPCARTLAARDVVVIPDLAEWTDPSVSRHVGWLGGMRFYAAAPIRVADTYALGTLAVYDTLPRTVSGRQRRSLAALADEITVILQARR